MAPYLQPAVSERIGLHVTVYIDPSSVPAFVEAIEPVYKAVCAEPECTFFEIYQSPENPGEISWVEHWAKSGEWLLNVQIKKPYYKEYLEVTEKMFVKPREIKILNRVGHPYVYISEENKNI